VFLHVRMVRKLRDYAQESGRAGRDGRKSEAIILKSVRRTRKGGRIEDKMAVVEDSMVEFLMTKECRQVVLDRIVDGRFNREGCEEGEEQCMGGLVEDVDVFKSIEKHSIVSGGVRMGYIASGVRTAVDLRR
jgi:superfamily II DNA helicase RecQ